MRSLSELREKAISKAIDELIVEVWFEGEHIADVHRAQEGPGIRIVSKRALAVVLDYYDPVRRLEVRITK